MREFGQDVKWGVDFGAAFSQEFSVRTGETAANIATLGGYGGVKKAYNEGRVTSTDFWSTGRAYAEGVYNTITLGGGERAVDAYAEGKGAGGIALEAAKGVGETVLPINEVKTLADPSKNAWEKAEAFAMGTAKVAGLAAGGLAAKSAIVQRLANKPGLVTESAAAGADASLAPAEGTVAPAAPLPGATAGGGAVTSSGRFATLQDVQSQVDLQGQRAIQAAQRRGLSGAQGGNFADRLFNRYNRFLERELNSTGSDFGVQVQPSRDLLGNEVPYGSLGSRRLDATIIDRVSRDVHSGYDITMSLRRWNPRATNVDYVTRFRIGEGYIREFNPNGPRP
jgi:hypothetical protein